MSEEAMFEIKRDFLEHLAKEGKRVDGRGFNEFRPINIERNPVSLAEGSARVQVGETDVMAGIKASIGTPFNDRPNNGVWITNAELRPIASPDFELGPPRDHAIELARVVDRGIRESKMIDLSTLCLVPGEKVWMLFGDIHALDYCGNLFDSASLALVAALKEAVLKADNFDQLEKDFPIETHTTPISVTFAQVGGFLLMDPNLEEEQVARARLTVTTDDDGNIRAMQKGLAGKFTSDEIDQMVDAAVIKGHEIRKQFFA